MSIYSVLVTVPIYSCHYLILRPLTQAEINACQIFSRLLQGYLSNAEEVWRSICRHTWPKSLQGVTSRPLWNVCELLPTPQWRKDFATAPSARGSRFKPHGGAEIWAFFHFFIILSLSPLFPREYDASSFSLSLHLLHMIANVTHFLQNAPNSRIEISRYAIQSAIQSTSSQPLALFIGITLASAIIFSNSR